MSGVMGGDAPTPDPRVPAMAAAFAGRASFLAMLDGTEETPDSVARWLLAALDASPDLIVTTRSRSLDVAWREAGAALPPAFRLMVGELEEGGLWWATASKKLPRAEGFLSIVSSEDGRERGHKHDATPALALQALAARLRERVG